MSAIVEHAGVVKAVEADRVEVEITVVSACGSCKSRSVCSMSEQAEKMVTVYTEMPEQYEVGQEVTVQMEQVMGIKAVIYAYVVPFFIILAVLLVLMECGLGEVVSGLSSLGACALYYIGLWLFRHKLEKVMVFKIKQTL
ncbi:MAG: SoxR reducing system RseC family protein [Tidjanibacter sp.]|nr:SoxR reducing system RseC family protein [Tidjanibacter sp.]MBR4064525.1 SoxR reducing system RseC family protein [Tidjanibacter sp.]